MIHTPASRTDYLPVLPLVENASFSVIANMTCPYEPKFRLYGPTLCQLVSKTHAEVAINSGCFGVGAGPCSPVKIPLMVLAFIIQIY
jgi:hypothetical protein